MSQTSEDTEHGEQGQPAERRVRTEPNRRRVRVFFGGEAVADSSATVYLFEKDHLPVYYFPRSRPHSEPREAAHSAGSRRP